jgi:hypothetical protein
LGIDPILSVNILEAVLTVFVSTAHSSRSWTPVDISDRIEQICAESSTKHTTLQSSVRQEQSIINLGYECDQAGDDHRENRLDFYQLVELSAYLAQILRQINSDYYGTRRPRLGLVVQASHLFQTDIIRYKSRISGGTVFRVDTDPVKRSTILRALILFSMGGAHTAEYLRHDTGERVAWIVQLNTSACWIKKSWERKTAKVLIGRMQKHFAKFKHICDTGLVYEAVFNSYFLMLFSRQSCWDLRSEMDTMGAGAFSWQDLDALRTAHWRRSAEEAIHDID